MTDREKIEYVKSVYRRTKTLSELKQMALDLLPDAIQTVTITSGASEGASHSGEHSFPKVLVGQAIEELIAEKDPNYTPAPFSAQGTVIQLSL